MIFNILGKPKPVGPTNQPLKTNKPLTDVIEAPPLPREMVIRIPQSTDPTTHAHRTCFTLPDVLPGVIPAKSRLACDSAITGTYSQMQVNSTFAEGQMFLGFAYLAELSQRNEYRRLTQVIASELTRCWMEVISNGDDDVTDRIEVINKELKRLKVQDRFREAVEHDGLFGRGQIFIDTGDTDNPDELKTPLVMSARKVRRNGIKCLTIVEPTWTYPGNYNSSDPLKPDYFKPTSWYVMSKEVHDSRFLMFTARPVPTILKPAYTFCGLSITQIAKPYVDNWLNTRQAVTELVQSFSVLGIKTNMSSVLHGGALKGIENRALLFNQQRNNQGLMLLDKDAEEFFNVAVPLSTLDSLQAQAQEHMSSINGVPLVKLLGITPSGLNASSEGEIACWYDMIFAEQEVLFNEPLKKIIDLIQLSIFGDIDENIDFKWNPLHSLSAEEEAAARKTDAETDAIYIEAGVVSPQEVRERIARADNSAYASLDVDAVIPQPIEPETDEDMTDEQFPN